MSFIINYVAIILYINTVFYNLSVYRDDMRPIWLGLEEVVGRGRHRWQEDMSQVTWTKWKKGYIFFQKSFMKLIIILSTSDSVSSIKKATFCYIKIGFFMFR